MNTIELFGVKWVNVTFNPQFISIRVLVNERIGTVGITMQCIDSLIIDGVWKEDEQHKLLSLIHEKTIHGKPYFIYTESSKHSLEQLGAELHKYTPIERDYVLNDFPKNIIELQRRSLLMLYRQYPRYGNDITKFSKYDFFSEDYSDWAFVLEAMQRKNWIDIKMGWGGDGALFFLKPSLIGEEGWLEIERNIEVNFSKQVFVAMWFDAEMNKAAQKIEEAIKACELEPMRIDRKEHNNEISGEILFEIMNSRIVIADVTGQRNGVYFEAGFALGRKKSVIWSCKREDLPKVHFDTRQYNHVVWDNEDDLYLKLRDRILATLALENI